MLVQFTKDLTLSVGGLTVKSFKAGDKFDLPDEQAERHIAKGTVKAVISNPITDTKADKVEIENKAEHPDVENKATRRKKRK